MSPNAHKPWRPGPKILLAATLTLLLVVAQASDQWIFHHVVYAGMYERRWGQLLRMSGYLPLWGIVALALMLHDRVRQHRDTLREAGRRGLLLLWSAVLGGIVGEVLKIAFRRERPGMTDGAYVFRPWSEHPWSTAQFGLPSSEVAVAFAAAAALARLFPEGRVLWYTLAGACALTRVASGAHFMSDVVLGAEVGYLMTLAVWRRRSPRSGVVTEGTG
ncbi:MAG TPA: phosphatase PAP2 family protein [Gemmatimonadales bacterium]|nr:phosphatase PAP2 family protein [Gemmatimonadales bacterium]